MDVTPDQIVQVNASVTFAMSKIQEQLEMWIDLVTGAMQTVEDDPVLKRKQLSEGLRELGRTRQMLLHERDRHLEAYRQETGIVHETIIDFEAERRAIAGKLDRLRSVGSTEAVSE